MISELFAKHQFGAIHTEDIFTGGKVTNRMDCSSESEIFCGLIQLRKVTVHLLEYDLHTALKAALEVTLPAPSGQHLGLDDHILRSRLVT